MKKTFTVTAAILVIVGVFSAQAIGHGGAGEKQGKHFGHGKRGAQVWRAHLTVPAAEPTGPTSSIARYGHGKGSTGATGPTTTTGPVGKFDYVQNRKRYVWGVKLKGLTPSSTYTVSVAADPTATAKSKRAGKSNKSHHDPTPATGPTESAPSLPATVTTNERGWAFAAGKGWRGSFSLDKKTAYVVTVTDASGTVVLKGALLRKTHRAHGKCGGFSQTGSKSAKRHTHR